MQGTDAKHGPEKGTIVIAQRAGILRNDSDYAYGFASGRERGYATLENRLRRFRVPEVVDRYIAANPRPGDVVAPLIRTFAYSSVG